jgi:dTDP-4-amino-4,6-dideoxygalactose transaminase
VIPQFDLTRQYAQIEAELDGAVRRVLRSGRFILGPEGQAFERECEAYLGGGHAIGIASGSDALKLVLQGLGVGPGSEVITPAFSFVASATAVLQAGGRPVFADIEPRTMMLDPAAVAAKVTPRTRAILIVHLFGLATPMGALRAVDAHGVPIVEDAAQAFGATLDGRAAGRLGAAAAFSFYPTKNLGACGDAGLVTTDDGALAEHLRRTRNHGETSKYAHAELGWTSRLDELQAAILRVKLGHLRAWTEARRALAARYDAGLAGLPLVRPVEPPGAVHVYHQYTARTPRRDALAKHLAGLGIGTACHYPLPIPAQPLFRDLGYDATPFPAAWAASQEVLSLPCFPELRPDEVDAVIAAVRAFFEGDPGCER